MFWYREFQVEVDASDALICLGWLSVSAPASLVAYEWVVSRWENKNKLFLWINFSSNCQAKVKIFKDHFTSYRIIELETLGALKTIIQPLNLLDFTLPEIIFINRKPLWSYAYHVYRLSPRLEPFLCQVRFF